MTYLDFLASKSVVAQPRGFDGTFNLNPDLKPHARDIAAWMVKGGNRAVFASFGMAKTSIQLQVMDLILSAHDGRGLIVCPLGVKAEFVRESIARGFDLTPRYVRTDAEIAECSERLVVTNYERIRDGQIDPKQFIAVSLDEASILRSFGSKTYQTFLPLFDGIRFKFVATATPAPNRFKELIHYAGFLGIMDTGQALTRFFKRDSSQAGNLQLHPHKEREFWLWLNTWAVFINRPSDLGYSDEGYDLPPLKIIRHRLPVDYKTAGFDSWGQGKLVRDAATDLRAASKEKRDSLTDRVERARQIVADNPDDHWIIWHDLEDERRAVEKAIPGAVTVYGSQDIEDRERLIADFSDGRAEILATKPSIAGSGCNLQRHCHRAIYLGIGWKFNDFIQSVHRIQRFGQAFECEIHLIYTESEDHVHDGLMKKWQQHNELVGTMTSIVKEYGLSTDKIGAEMQRAIIDQRAEVKGELFTCVNSDNVPEVSRMEPNSVDLIVTSWPFSDHYEYTETYNDFGHNDGDAGFFAQMEYLSPAIMRALKPGRMYCVHAKDRIVYGSVSGDGMYTVNPFSDKCVEHLRARGFRYCGRITVVTDVVRENNQTYRLGWSENAKDGTKMGVGSPEYILLFRKLPTDQSTSYADEPVAKSKEDYTRARWQFDAHSFWRSDGNRFLTPEQIAEMPMDALRRAWLKHSREKVYDFGEHVRIAQEMESRGILPSSFMALEVANPGAPYVWDDVTRMRTLNGEQSRKGWEQHVCPLQLDIVERLIDRYSNPGDLVMDPFGGLGTVAQSAVLKGRRGYSIELSPDYHRDAVSYCRAAEQKVSMPTLFDFLEEDAA